MLGPLCYRFRVSAFNTPQFNLAEYAGPDICQYCRRPISGTYYRVRTAMACPECTDKLRAAMAKSDSSAYRKATLPPTHLRSSAAWAQPSSA